MAHTARQVMPSPPPVYDQAYIAKLADAVNRYMIERESGELNAPRFICSDPIRVPGDMPDTSTLPTGLLYLRPVPAAASSHAEMLSVPGITSTNWAMAGLGVTFAPAYESKGIFILNGQVGNTASSAETQISLAYGVGPPPVNGAPLTGTLVGQVMRHKTQTGSEVDNFSQTVLLTGLTPGTTYWVGLAVKVDKGASRLSDMQITGFGLRSAQEYFWTVVGKEDV